MFNTFAPDARHQPAPELIPANTLAFAVVTVQAIGFGKETGGRNAKLELTIDRGPYEGRKIWHYLGDPTDPKNSEKYQQMSMSALQHMLEVAGIFDPANPTSYQVFANADFTQIMQALDGKTVAIKVKIDKGTGGFEDKNVVADWLSPNPASRSFKKWQELTGQAPTSAAPPAQGQVFAGNPAAAATSYAPNAGAPASGTGTPAYGGGTPAAGGKPNWLK